MSIRHIQRFINVNVTPLQLLIDTENAGVTANDSIRIPLVGTANIEWGDGNIDFGASGTTDHTYDTAGQYVIKISASADSIAYNDTNDDTKLLEIQAWGSMGWTTFNTAFFGCSNMTITAVDLPNSGGVTVFDEAFKNCEIIPSFPLIDTSEGISFDSTWRGCDLLTSFPLIDISSCISLLRTWQDCISFTSFPLIDTTSCTSFLNVWNGCNSLTSFPLLDTSAVLIMNGAWISCSALTTFPLLDTSLVTAFDSTFQSCTGLTSFPLIDTSSGDIMIETFKDCTSLTAFPTLDLSAMSIGTNMFENVTLDTDDWSDLMIETEANTVMNNVTWDGGNSLFNVAGGVARAALIADHTWTITDGGAA